MGHGMTASIAIVPQALTAHQVGVAMASRGKGDLGRGVRRMYRDGKFPAPIDPSLPAASWRWSPVVIGAHINPQVAA
jgi:hypothetical protein